VATTLLAATACSDDADSLNALETQALVAEFFDLLELVEIPLLDPGPAAASGPALVPYGDAYDDEIDGESACDAGGAGTITGLITGDVDPVDETGDVTVTATADFVGCVQVGEVSTLTLDGDPDVGIIANIVVTEGSISIIIDTNGAIAWRSNDDRSGTCVIDLTITATEDEVTGIDQSASGRACGASAATLDLELFDES
jgi:hypothetical protein